MLKNTLFLSATLGLALFAPACGGDKDGGTGDTATTTTVTGDDDDDDTGVVPLGFALTFDCTTVTQLDMQVTSPVLNGSQAVVDYADTNNNNPYYEAHTLLPTSSDDAGTIFDLSIPTDTGSYEDGVQSLFSCAADTHFGEANLGDVMTYVVRAYDSAGALDDCFAGGNDAAGMIDKAYKDYGNTINHADISPNNCTALRSAN